MRGAAIISGAILAFGMIAVAPGSATRQHPTNGFSASGPWNTRLPRHVPLDPRSAEIVRNIKADRTTPSASGR